MTVTLYIVSFLYSVLSGVLCGAHLYVTLYIVSFLYSVFCAMFLHTVLRCRQTCLVLVQHYRFV